MFFVGSYGRGTAIGTSDVDLLVVLPNDEYMRVSAMEGNQASRFLQIFKQSILKVYPRSKVCADGQVVCIDFTDGIKFEILPTFIENSHGSLPVFDHADTHYGGRWKSTNPLAEIHAMRKLNVETKGLLCDTCKHLRYLRDRYFANKKLSGIVIDSFVYQVLLENKYMWTEPGQSALPKGYYERILLSEYKRNYCVNKVVMVAPGSNDYVDPNNGIMCLGELLNYMVCGNEQ